ncbi:hypothetical protein COU95_03035 [Candidatus Shapirobacteria bacterium CG10_big_fil_rev_8_21_14_0_10_40_9]|uniref:Glycosyltransferase RgtA/B/C/D-like domain-containing protein n=1 Tax=Candidatus Shapirobacteria bacterium CG10_big_fil_rev_8_21_14_0_10_40_9 TaxID=1974888 RepID=A0A2M8L350_9BACT|nr:MAG: hypothetical protein COU95_03035 [Candidatus Shapirobacteria bacterium CG10_big_fil_rev_8_21_14_0_10_40_9]
MAFWVFGWSKAKIRVYNKNRMQKKSLIFLFLILLLAASLRFFRLSIIPPGLFGDEVDTGYQAYSILRTGKDYFGNFLPVHFQSFGDWRVPLYIYLDTVFVAMLGLSELAVRLPSAILGILGVLLAFFLVKKITSDEKISLLSAFLLSVSPWHIQISRVGLEAIFLPVLFPAGLILFWRGKDEKKAVWLVLSALCLGLTPYAYSTPKLFLPLLVLLLFLLWGKELGKQKKKLVIFLTTLALVLLPLGLNLIKGSGQARFLGISIFSNPEIPERVRQARQNCDYQGGLARILHNKVTFWIDDFSKNYLSSISTDFLFGKGDPNPRHSVGSRGELYLWELPFLLLGLGLTIFKAFKEKDKIYQFILGWLVLAPVPAALTIGGGTHALRLFLFLPWLQVLTALGIFSVWEFFKSKRIKILYVTCLTLLASVSLFLYLHQYFVHYPKVSGRWWNYGYREIFDYVKKVESKYQKINISPSWEPSIVYTLFYSQYPPEKTQKEITISAVDIGKYHFLSPDLGRVKRGEGEKKTLYVLNPAELEIANLKLKDSPEVKFIKDIKAPDGSTAFVIFSSADVLTK